MRGGGVDASKPLRQRDFPQQLGTGTSTIAKAGCLLLCIDNAAHRLIGSPRDPVALNARGVAHDCFDGSSAFTERLAAQAGLVCGPRVEQSIDVMSKLIASYLASGRLVLAHVDHDSTLPKGDPEADHWVLIHAHAGLTYIYDDSAPGEMGGLVTTTLSAPSAWRDRRPYVVRGFRTVRRSD